ncbi:MAG: hypothetical protein HQL39_20605 [Alphaproteobacteria bacterium]|nr:hypothetical protein [Alphaproteobacteria bacterium]
MSRKKKNARRGYPDVVEYETTDGRRHPVPPLGGLPYKLIIHDLARYEALFRAGGLGLGHAYASNRPVVDNRPGG